MRSQARNLERRSQPNSLETAVHIKHQTHSHIWLGTHLICIYTSGNGKAQETPIQGPQESNRWLPRLEPRPPRTNIQGRTSPGKTLGHESQSSSKNPGKGDPRQPHQPGGKNPGGARRKKLVRPRPNVGSRKGATLQHLSGGNPSHHTRNRRETNSVGLPTGKKTNKLPLHRRPGNQGHSKSSVGNENQRPGRRGVDNSVHGWFRPKPQSRRRILLQP